MIGRKFSGAGVALFSVVRFWSRRWALRTAAEATGEERHVRAVMIVEAVATAGRSDREVSVLDVAHQLGVDHSGASRFVADTVANGYLKRVASETDRRRAALFLTPAGEQLLADARAWQETAFAELVADWDPSEAEQFARSLKKLANQLAP